MRGSGRGEEEGGKLRKIVTKKRHEKNLRKNNTENDTKVWDSGSPSKEGRISHSGGISDRGVVGEMKKIWDLPHRRGSLMARKCGIWGR
jgi:hypothetical protein